MGLSVLEDLHDALKEYFWLHIRREPKRYLNELFSPGWGCNEGTVCGEGSTVDGARYWIEVLPQIIKKYNFKIINDAGCGDLNWIRQVDLRNIDYLGYDVVPRESWKNSDSPKVHGESFDIVHEPMRPCDLTICKDVVNHLSLPLAQAALENFKRNSRYLFITNCTYYKGDNRFSRSGIRAHWNPYNFDLAPFELAPYKLEGFLEEMKLDPTDAFQPFSLYKLQ